MTSQQVGIIGTFPTLTELLTRPGRPKFRARRQSNGEIGMGFVVSGTVKGTNTEQEFSVDPSGQQLYTPGELPYTELSRLGQGWSTMATAAVAALVVRPSTVAALELWNGNTTAMLADRLFTYNLVASAIQGTFQIWAQVTVPKTAPSTASLAIGGDSGKLYSGNVINAVGTTVVANGWFPWGNSPAFGLGTATPGGGMEGNPQGRILVPPNCSLCIHVTAQTTAWTFQSGAHWYEKGFTPAYSIL